jgi:hypothetical protein
MHYDVVYEYADKRYSIQMLNDPGQYVRLSVTPVGVLPPPNRTPMQPQSSYQQYQQPTQQTGITMGEPRQNRY